MNRSIFRQAESKVIVLGIAVIAGHVAGCAVQLHNVKVLKERPADTPRFSRVAIPPVVNTLGPDISTETVELISPAIRKRLAESHEGAFEQITTAPSSGTDELVVQGRIASFESTKTGPMVSTRFSGAGAIYIEITTVDGRTGRVLEQFIAGMDNLQSIGTGGSIDAKNIAAGISVEIARRIALYGMD